MLTNNLHVQVAPDGGVLSRRHFLRNVSLGTAGIAGGLTWMDAVRAAAPDLRKNGMACILLFMRGGPSQFETFDPSRARPMADRPRRSTPPPAAFRSPRAGSAWPMS